MWSVVTSLDSICLWHAGEGARRELRDEKWMGEGLVSPKSRTDGRMGGRAGSGFGSRYWPVFQRWVLASCDCQGPHRVLHTAFGEQVTEWERNEGEDHLGAEEVREVRSSPASQAAHTGEIIQDGGGKGHGEEIQERP